MGKLDNIVVKGENAGYQHVLFPQCFQKLSSLEESKFESIGKVTKELTNRGNSVAATLSLFIPYQIAVHVLGGHYVREGCVHSLNYSVRLN